ncbi:hypothetical protein [Moorena sp. SIO3B2]|nr:hypothetical protein [Moorena sp. SIO3B2]
MSNWRGFPHERLHQDNGTAYLRITGTFVPDSLLPLMYNKT